MDVAWVVNKWVRSVGKVGVLNDSWFIYIYTIYIQYRERNVDGCSKVKGKLLTKKLELVWMDTKNNKSK